MTYLINRVTFKGNGEEAGQDLKIDVADALLFVGPNESGKSYALNSLRQWISGEINSFDNGIFSSVDFGIFPENEFYNFMRSMITAGPNEISKDFSYWHASDVGEISEYGGANYSSFGDPASYLQSSWRTHLRAMSNAPNAHTMQKIIEDQQARPLYTESIPSTLPELLLSRPDKLAKVNQLISYATDSILVVELTSDGKFRFQLNSEEPPHPFPSLLLNNVWKYYYEKGRNLNTLGDGLRRFVSLVLSIFPFEHKIVYLDEPELNLHPPLVKYLARELLSEMKRRNGQMIVSTHSADFVEGCASVGAQVSVARLSYARIESRSSVKVITNAKLEPFITNRVIRNTDSLNGLFHKTVIIVEGALDKIAYSELNRVFLQENPEDAISDPLFISSGGCTSVMQVARALRCTGTPTAIILDFDVLYSESIKWDEALLNDLIVPQSIHASLLQSLAEIKECLKNALHGLSKDERNSKLANIGIKILDANEELVAQRVLGLLAENGVFILTQGALEAFVASTLHFDRSNLSKDQIIIEKCFGILASREYEIPEVLTSYSNDFWSLLAAIESWSKKNY